MNDSNQKEHIYKKSTYLLLLVFLGFTGAHKFYSKNYVKALFMFCLFLMAMRGWAEMCIMGLVLLTIYLFDLIKALIFEPIVKLLSGILSANNNCEHKFKKFDYIFYLIFGGIIGLHHFYSKNIKKARMYLGWFMFAVFMFFIHNDIRRIIYNLFNILILNTPLNCNEMDYDCHKVNIVYGKFGVAFGGPFGAFVIKTSIFIILCFCLVDLIIVISKKSDKDGYITF